MHIYRRWGGGAAGAEPPSPLGAEASALGAQAPWRWGRRRRGAEVEVRYVMGRAVGGIGAGSVEEPIR